MFPLLALHWPGPALPGKGLGATRDFHHGLLEFVRREKRPDGGVDPHVLVPAADPDVPGHAGVGHLGHSRAGGAATWRDVFDDDLGARFADRFGRQAAAIGYGPDA